MSKFNSLALPARKNSQGREPGSRLISWIPVVSMTFALLLGAFVIPKDFSQEFSDYHSYDELTAKLKALAKANPTLARLQSAGKTQGGRDIWMMEIGHNTGTPIGDRPAVLIAANFEGNQVGTSEIALGAISYLLDNYASNDAVKKSLDNQAFYFFPRVNPDGAEKMFAPLQTGTSTNSAPYDDDNDGRTDEDAPEDLNKDGLITLMRVPDPSGLYMVDPLDARLMKKADPKKGESGTYSIYWEGLDNDGDGFYNEDAVGGTDINRNFQHEYPYYQRGAGLHMVSERETRAVLDFVIDHRNIAAILVYGPNDNLISAPTSKGELAKSEGINLLSFADASFSEAGKVGMFSTQTQQFFGGGGGGGGGAAAAPTGGGGRRPATTVATADLEYYTTISKKYVELTGIKNAPAMSTPAGAFFQYGYFQYGVPSFSTPGWGLTPAATDSVKSGSGPKSKDGSSSDDKPSFDKKLIDWMDGAGVDGFVAWKAFTHPTLGSIEIGGFKPYEAVNPPMSVINEMAPKNGEFAVYLSSLFADVNIAKTEVINHGGGVFRIKAEVENAGFLPTSTSHGVTSRSVKPTMVQLGIDPEALLSGSAKTSFFQALDGSGNRQKFEWLIKGKKGDEVELKVVAQKGGTDIKTVRLQ